MAVKTAEELRVKLESDGKQRLDAAERGDTSFVPFYKIGLVPTISTSDEDLYTKDEIAKEQINRVRSLKLIIDYNLQSKNRLLSQYWVLRL